MNIDYDSYSVDELEDVLENIDKEAWPDRYEKAKASLKHKRILEAQNNIEATSKDEKSQIDFNSSKQKLITIILVLFIAFIIVTGEIPAKSTVITYDESPGHFVFFVLSMFSFFIWRIIKHIESHNKAIKKSDT